MSLSIETRNTLIRAAYVPLALAAQVTFAPVVSIVGVQPSMLLAVFALFSFRAGALAAIWMGFGCGMVLDTYASGAPGAFALAMAVTGFLIGLFDERRVHVSHPLRVTVLGVSVLIHDGIWHLVSHHGANALGMFLFRVSLPSALYTMSLGAILFAFRPPRIQARSW
jgi:rod shape-determining protein MreD